MGVEQVDIGERDQPRGGDVVTVLIACVIAALADASFLDGAAVDDGGRAVGQVDVGELVIELDVFDAAGGHFCSHQAGGFACADAGEDHILPTDDDAVVVAIAVQHQRVGAGTAADGVVTAAGEQQIIAGATAEAVIAGATTQGVVTGTADHRVVASEIVGGHIDGTVDATVIVEAARIEPEISGDRSAAAVANLQVSADAIGVGIGAGVHPVAEPDGVVAIGIQ